jgi:glyoxylase-like metal-dependent hydrolase (beta-lactamase superfamily II)
MEVMSGLHQLKVPIPNNPLGYVMPYLFEVPGGCAIIDPGWDADESLQALESQLGELGYATSDVKQILITHMHPDHYGLANKVKAASGADILVHDEEMKQVRWRNERMAPLVDDWFHRYGLPEDAAPINAAMRGRRWHIDITPDAAIEDNEVIELGNFKLQALWTPGHTAGHVCFYIQDEELLIAGDHLLPTISPNVSLWPGSDDNPLQEYLISLERLRGMKAQHVLPAHQYSFDDLEGRLDELEVHHDDRLQQMVDAVRGGSTTGYQVAREVRWSIGHFDKFDAGTQRAAMTETVAHLRYLVSIGRLKVSDEAGIDKFAVA